MISDQIRAGDKLSLFRPQGYCSYPIDCKVRQIDVVGRLRCGASGRGLGLWGGRGVVVDYIQNFSYTLTDSGDRKFVSHAIFIRVVFSENRILACVQCFLEAKPFIWALQIKYHLFVLAHRTVAASRRHLAQIFLILSHLTFFLLGYWGGGWCSIFLFWLRAWVGSSFTKRYQSRKFL